MRSEFRISWTVFACLSPLPFVYSVPLLVPPFVRMSVVYVSLHPSPPENEGTEVSEWRTEEGKNGVRNGLSSLIHFAVLSPLLCHSARYTHLVPRSGLSGMRRSDEDRGEKSRVPAVRRFGSPHVISARFLRMSFTPFTRRSRSGGRKWTGVNGMLTSGENREPKASGLTHGINVSPLVVMFRPPCVVPSVSTSPVCSLTLFFSFPPPLHLRSRAAPFGTRRGGDVKEKMWRGKEVTTRNRRSLTGTTGELK